MEAILQPTDKSLLKAELTPDKFLRNTNKGGNEIYIITAANSPHLMREVSRLREWAFRQAGGGSGRSCDTDEYDVMEKPYKQLIVWNPDDEEIIGGYRYIVGSDVVLDEQGQPRLATAEMYYFSEKFLQEYLPYTLELGRSFVHPDYQSSKKGAKSLFALDNLWDGLGALVVQQSEIRYAFGKVTVYPHYNAQARDLIFSFITKHFEDKERLVYPHDPFPISPNYQSLSALFSADDYKENLKVLNQEVRALGVNIPPLVHAYLGLSPSMYSFGFAVYHNFGSLIEACIMIPLDQMYEEKKKRHIASYLHHEA